MPDLAFVWINILGILGVVKSLLIGSPHKAAAFCFLYLAAAILYRPPGKR